MNLKITLPLLAFIGIFSSQNLQAQEAEELFHEKYSKLSLILQPSILKGYNYTRTDPGITFNNTNSFQFGFAYNFAQSKNFNFRAGVVAKVFRPTFDINMTDEQIGAGPGNASYLTDFEMSNQFVISETFKTEYFYPITKKINLVAGIGVSLDLRTGGDDEILSVDVTNTATGESNTVFASTATEEQITASVDFSIGANYKTNFGLFQLEIFSNNQLLSSPKEGNFKLHPANGESVQGSYTIHGNYTGLSLTFSPKKSWLKKKAKN